MIRRLAVLIAALTLALALMLPGVALAQYKLNVRDADVRAFVADVAEVTGRTFIVDARVQGKVSVVSDRALNRSEYFEVFLSTLRANGLVAVPTGNGAFRIQPADGAASQPGQIGSKGAARNQMITEVVRLRTIGAAQAVETLRPLVSKEGSITANQAAGSLVIVDYADNLRRIRDLVSRIDRDQSDSAALVLEHAGAREVAGALTQLSASGPDGARSNASVVAVDSANTVLVRGDASTVARLTDLARRIDAEAARGGQIRVVWLDYADAAVLVPVLERLAGGQGGAEVTSGSQGPVSLGGVGGSAAGMAGQGQGSLNNANAVGSNQGTANPTGATSGGLGSGPIRQDGGRAAITVTRYPGANAVIIGGALDDQKRLADLVRQLDVPQAQVLVEAIIVEVSDTVAQKLGVQMLLGGKDIPFAVSNFSNAAPNILSVAGGLYADRLDQSTTVVNGSTVTTTSNSPTGDYLRNQAAQAVLGASGGFGGYAADLGHGRFFGALINAIRSDTNSNILSTPHITTNNNVPASILFGQEIPVATGEAVSQANFGNTFRTIQRQNVGIELDVTPQINAGSQVRLDLRQQVSSIAGPVSSSNSELIVNKREIRTTVTVGDQEIVVLGGLLDDNERRTIEKVPLLSSVPVLGELFKSRGKSRVKTNLMVFIRPTILRNGADRAALTGRRYGAVRQAETGFDPTREPGIDDLIADYLGAALPVAPPLQPDTSPPSGTPPAAAMRGDAVIAPARPQG
ncbi:type II secretion system secretin GspD [Novosphingobium sp.]|uniref:type II secretion system secretin GspD n=1 Tax=Novosphingobium sp. TaxID=1874826 RepID=UPI0038BD73EE